MSDASKKVMTLLNAKYNAKAKRPVDIAEATSACAIHRLFSSVFDENFQKGKVTGRFSNLYSRLLTHLVVPPTIGFSEGVTVTLE